MLPNALTSKSLPAIFTKKQPFFAMSVGPETVLPSKGHSALVTLERSDPTLRHLDVVHHGSPASEDLLAVAAGLVGWVIIVLGLGTSRALAGVQLFLGQEGQVVVVVVPFQVLGHV